MSSAARNSWQLVCATAEISANPAPARAHGEDLAVFRSASGQIRLFSAWCPHLGAHLGHGGTLDGDELVCPFHHWRFGRDGGLRCVPYSPREAPKVSLELWPTHEVAGLLFTHPPGEPQPSASPLQPLDAGAWSSFRRLPEPRVLPGVLRRAVQARIRTWRAYALSPELTLHEAAHLGVRLLVASEDGDVPKTMLSVRRLGPRRVAS